MNEDQAKVLDAIEAALKRLGWWRVGNAPDIPKEEPFCGLSFEMWLQYVFLFFARKGAFSPR